MAKRLRDWGVTGILITAAEHGYITEAKCGMPQCFCPEELGGAWYFEPVTAEYSDWSPTHEHFPVSKRDGGQRTVDNSVLAHRLCNRIDYSIFAGRSHASDLERIRKAREAAASGPGMTPHGGPVVNSARSYERLTLDDLTRLAQIAKADREARFARRPRWKPYADRVLCVALCQGAALHFIDGRNGVKDFDVYTFYAEHSTGTFPYRWMTKVDFGISRFGRYPSDPASFRGRRIDLIGRSLDVDPNADPVEAVRHYLAAGRTETSRQLARKAVVVLEPEPLRGQVIWPRSSR